MSYSNGAYVAVPPLSLGAATQPIQLTDVMIITQNGVTRECTVGSFLASSSLITNILTTALLANWFATLPTTPQGGSPPQPWNNGGMLAFS